MLRAIFLVALAVTAVVVSAEETRSADQQEFYGAHGLGKGPFCDSHCLPNGSWRMRRDWWSMQSQTDDVFLWMADGDEQFWNREANDLGGYVCGEYINMLVFGGGYISNTVRDYLEDNCRPDHIYLFHYDVNYDHHDGHLVEKVWLGGSFEPTSSAWNQFVRDAQNIQDDVDQDLYTQPSSIIRLAPDVDGQRISGSRKDDVVFQRTFIANYERNFCTFRGSWSPTMQSAWCDFHDDSESSVTKYFCNGGPYRENTGTYVSFDCDSDEDCDSIYFGYLAGNNAKVEQKRKSVPASKFLELATSVVGGVSAEHKSREELHKNYGFRSTEILKLRARDAERAGEKEKRGFSYVGSWENQPHSYYSNYFNNVNVNEYYYVPFSSNIVAPYCGYRI